MLFHLGSGEVPAVSRAENATRRDGAARRAVAPLKGGATAILFRSDSNLFPKRNYEAYVIEFADRIVGSGKWEIHR